MQWKTLFPALISSELSVTFGDEDGGKEHPSVLQEMTLINLLIYTEKPKEKL